MLMHVTTIKNVHFLHDGDYSGETVIKNVNQPDIPEFEIETSILIDYVIGILKEKLISDIENMAAERFFSKFGAI